SRVLLRLLSRLDGASEGLLLVPDLASPLRLAVAGVDECFVLLDGIGFRLDGAEATGAADELPRRQLLALLLQPRRLLLARRVLALLAFRLALGKAALDRRRGYAAGELVEHLRPSQLARLVDALPVGVRQPVRVGQPLRE